LHLGKVGAILLDDVEAYDIMSRWRSDGRDLTISPWQQQTNFGLGYHYCPTLEDCARGAEIVSRFSQVQYETPQHVAYPDLRELSIQPTTADLTRRANRYTVY
jgi:hypothetical protein